MTSQVITFGFQHSAYAWLSMYALHGESFTCEFTAKYQNMHIIVRLSAEYDGSIVATGPGRDTTCGFRPAPVKAQT